jgi:hypothetical protein
MAAVTDADTGEGRLGDRSRPDRGEKVNVSVNKLRVVLRDDHPTGLEIKQAAIAQGVEIKLDFVLKQERKHDEPKVIDDDERVKVDDGDDFIAISQEKKIKVEVNDDRVVLKGKRQTGLSIKEASIAQGIDIDLDFILKLERKHGDPKVIDDDENITVEDGDRFTATPRVVKINITVNTDPVVLDNKRQTGMSIKQAAIAQGVDIKTDFVLSIERRPGRTELIGDNQPIKVKDGDDFLAVPNDDNS